MGKPTRQELQDMTVAQLRELASGTDHEAVQGYTQLRKDELVDALCSALEVRDGGSPEDPSEAVHKRALKARMKELKGDRDRALSAGDHAELKRVRRKMRGLKRRLRRAAS